MAPTSDPYAVLGVSRAATDAQIAQARRRLSRAYHPDVNPAPDAAARFDEVQQAFHLLSDPAARADYDRADKPGQSRPRRPAKTAPGILVHPAAVDFGLLPKWDGTVAAVTVSWTGASPRRIITYTPGQDWWTILRSERPDLSSVVFFLRARAQPRAIAGQHRDQFTVTLDGTTVAVPLTAEIRREAPGPFLRLLKDLLAR